MSDKISRVVLAFSGGLDTSVILKWLQQTYGCEVVTFTADLGQGEELEPGAAQGRADGGQARAYLHRRSARGVRRATYVFPMMRANALYEGLYLLGTSIARPLIAKRQIEIARQVGADAVSHGATGKGNDQVRFELGYYALAPDIKVIAPWREWDLTSRTALIEFAEKHQIPVPKDKRGESPFSTDANLLHTSSRGQGARGSVGGGARLCLFAHRRPGDRARHARRNHHRVQGAATASRSTARRCRPATLLAKLNELGKRHGIGRLDLVENRFVGMKSRGMYETPGGTIYHAAHRGDRAADARPRRRAPQGRADAALCGADLQRLLVLAGARDAAGGDRP